MTRVIRTFHERINRKAAVLVDEHGKPILDTLDKSAVVNVNCKILQGLHSMIDASDGDIRLSFIISASMFSGPNPLTDIA